MSQVLLKFRDDTRAGYYLQASLHKALERTGMLSTDSRMYTNIIVRIARWSADNTYHLSDCTGIGDDYGFKLTASERRPIKKQEL